MGAEMAPERNLRRNVRLMYWQEFLLNAMSVNAVFWLFLKDNGFTIGQMLTLEACFAVFLVGLEIPSGYFADCIGRKRTMIIGTVAGLAGYFVYVLSHTFGMFLMAEFLIAVMVSLHSGTTEAFIRDWYTHVHGDTQETERKFRPTFRNLQMLGYIGQVCGSAIAIVLAPMEVRWTWWATIVTASIGLVFILRMQEPPHNRQPRENGILTLCLHTLRMPALRYLILFNGFLCTMGLIMFWMCQPYMEALGTTRAFFGVIHLTVMMMGLAAQFGGKYLERRCDDRVLLFLVMSVMVGCMALSGWLPMHIGIGCLLIGRTGWGFLRPIVSAISSRNVPGDMTATMLSIQNFVHRLLFTLLTFSFLRTTADGYGTQGTLRIMSTVGLCFIPLIFLLLLRYWHLLAHRTVAEADPGEAMDESH